MQSLPISALRARLIEGGPAALAGLLAQDPAPGAEATEADAYEALAGGRPGAAFVLLHGASLAWREAGDAIQASLCDDAAVSLFVSAFPPHQDDFDALDDAAEWLLWRLEFERARLEARADQRPAPGADAWLDVAERRHRWFCRLLAGRNAGVAYRLDALCNEQGLGVREHEWLTGLLAVQHERAIARAAARIPGEEPPRLSAALLADCLHETAAAARASLAALAPGAPLRRLGLVTVEEPWPGAPLGACRVWVGERAAAYVENRAARPEPRG